MHHTRQLIAGGQSLERSFNLLQPFATLSQRHPVQAFVQLRFQRRYFIITVAPLTLELATAELKQVAQPANFIAEQSRVFRLLKEGRIGVCKQARMQNKGQHLGNVVQFNFGRSEEVSHDFGINDERRSEERRVGKECRSRWWPYH